MAGVSSVVIQIGAQTAGAVSEIKKVDNALGETQSTGEKMRGGLQKAFLPAVAALTGLAAAGVSAAKAAATDAESQSKLEGQMKRSAGATDAQVAATEDWISKMSIATATADDDLRPAMAKLVSATGDATEAQGLLKLSLDLSAATGKDLASTSAAVAKGATGHAAALKKLVPSLDDAAVKAGDWNAIQKELNKQVGGAAAKDADTTAGKYRGMTIQMGELQEKIGTALLPVMAELADILIPLISIASEHSTVFLILAGGVAALASAVIAANAALKIYDTWQALAGARAKIAVVWTNLQTAATWLLDAAVAANPLGLLIIGLAALAAGLVLAWHYSGTFREVVTDAFKWVIKYGWLLAGPLTPFILALKLAWEHSETFRRIVTGAFDAVLDAIHAVIDAIHSVTDLFGRIHKPSWLSLPGGLAVAPAGFSASTLSVGGQLPSLNVHIHGAIDPESTAIAVRRVLERYDRRRGRLPGLA